MTNEMNSLHDLIFGQNQMIDGCLLEMQKSICLSGSIIAEDSTVEEISRSTIASFGEAGQLLREWMEVMLDMFPNCQDLLNMIPDPDDMSPTKLLGGMVSTDACNTARLTRQTLCDAIIQKGRDMGLDDEHVKVYPKIFCSVTYS